MSITIEIEQSVEAALTNKASAAGVSLEKYVLRILEHDAKIESPEDPTFSDAMSRLEKYRGKLGPIPEGALDPELLYGNR